MPRTLKILIGLTAVLLMGWVWHGPLGHGKQFIDGVEAHARRIVAYADLPGISVRLGRDPLARNAVMSGQANDFQRRGLQEPANPDQVGVEPGLIGRVATADGIGAIRWDDEPRPTGWALPLLAETLIQLVFAYALGFGLGALLFGRRRRESFLD